MTTTTKNFTFEELNITLDDFAGLLGSHQQQVPEHFLELIKQALIEANTWTGIQGGYHILPVQELSHQDLILNNIKFNPGNTICSLLHDSTQMAVVACTAGLMPQQLASAMMENGDIMAGYIYDMLGSVIVESATFKIQHILQQQVSAQGLHVTNLYSPGHCQWPVVQQNQLFSLLPANFCSIELNSSAMMQPTKSLSGIVGIGEKVKYQKQTCAICSLKDCKFRQHKVTMQHRHNKLSQIKV